MGNSSLLALCFTDDRATGSTACTECYSDWCTNKNFFIKNKKLTAESGALSAIGLELHAPSQCSSAPPMGENGQPGCGACRRLGLHWRLQMFDGVLAAMADHGKDDHGSDKDKGARVARVNCLNDYWGPTTRYWDNWTKMPGPWRSLRSRNWMWCHGQSSTPRRRCCSAPGCVWRPWKLN